MHPPIERYLRGLAGDNTRRCLIMHNEIVMGWACGYFTGGWDSIEDANAVSQMFSDSLFALQRIAEKTFTVEQLPIVQHIGKFQATYVRKTPGGIIISNAFTNQPVSNHIGMESTKLWDD